MNLEEFVSDSLTGILNGVRAVNNTKKESPFTLKKENGISFNLVITITDTKNTEKNRKGEIKIFSANVGGGSESSKLQTNTNHSTLSFTIDFDKEKIKENLNQKTTDIYSGDIEEPKNPLGDL